VLYAIASQVRPSVAQGSPQEPSISTMRCRSGKPKALRCAVMKNSTMRCQFAIRQAEACGCGFGPTALGSYLPALVRCHRVWVRYYCTTQRKALRSLGAESERC